MDYVQLCGVPQSVDLLQLNERVTAEEYEQIRKRKQDHVLIDVREKEHFDLCSVEGSINIPISQFMNHRGDDGTIPDWLPPPVETGRRVYVVCRVGNDSQIATQKLKQMGLWTGAEESSVQDIVGGLRAWKDSVDPSMPLI